MQALNPSWNAEKEDWSSLHFDQDSSVALIRQVQSPPSDRCWFVDFPKTADNRVKETSKGTAVAKQIHESRALFQLYIKQWSSLYITPSSSHWEFHGTCQKMPPPRVTIQVSSTVHCSFTSMSAHAHPIIRPLTMLPHTFSEMPVVCAIIPPRWANASFSLSLLPCCFPLTIC